jgi:hypothetical protein
MLRLYIVLVFVLAGDASMRLYIVLVVVLAGDASMRLYIVLYSFWWETQICVSTLFWLSF